MRRRRSEPRRQPEPVRRAELWRAVYWRLVNIELGASRLGRSNTLL